MALAGFDDAPVFDRLPGWEPGTYVAEVLNIAKYEGYETKEEKDLPDNARAWFFKGEFRIVEAQTGSGNNANSLVADVMPLHGPWKKLFYGKSKSMLGAIANEPPRTIKETDIDEAAAEDQPFKGAKVRVFVVKANKTKKPGETFNRATYAPFDSVVTQAPA